MWRRVALAAVALAQAEIGLWGELSPRGFYRTFPGVFGQHWVAMLGPYNEHLVREHLLRNEAARANFVGLKNSASDPALRAASAWSARAWLRR